MKKIILILVSILIIVHVLFSMLGLSKEYSAQRILYKAIKITKTLAANPDVIPPAMAEAVEQKLNAVVKKYPATNAAKAAWITLAEFQIFAKEYDKARETLDSIIDTYKDDSGIVTRAIFMKGSAYERQNQWGKALAEYTRLRDNYRNTSLGFQMPIYIADRYAQQGKDEEAARAYSEAAAYYEKATKENKASMVGYLASTVLVRAYFNLKEYNKAGELVEEIIDAYPSNTTYVQQLPSVDFIYVKQLKMPEKALAIYKSVNEKTSDRRLRKILQQKIAELESKK